MLEYFFYGIYVVLEILMVGMIEEEVKECGIFYECGVVWFWEIFCGYIMGFDIGMLKMIFLFKIRRLLGCYIVGEGVIELVYIG